MSWSLPSFFSAVICPAFGHCGIQTLAAPTCRLLASAIPPPPPPPSFSLLPTTPHDLLSPAISIVTPSLPVHFSPRQPCLQLGLNLQPCPAVGWRPVAPVYQCAHHDSLSQLTTRSEPTQAWGQRAANTVPCACCRVPQSRGALRPSPSPFCRAQHAPSLVDWRARHCNNSNDFASSRGDYRGRDPGRRLGRFFLAEKSTPRPSGNVVT